MRLTTSLQAALLAAAIWALPAAAEPPREAARLYAAGDFLAAARAAESVATFEGQAFAAHALLAACFIGADGPDLLLARAERAARAAFELEPSSVDARLALALVYGMRGRRAPMTEAFARGYAPRGRALIEEALAIAPDNARAHALLGAWHLEVLRRAGRVGALVYGARYEDGVAAFEQARALAPEDPMIALHYAAALIELDASAHAERARALFLAAAQMTPRDALEAHARRYAAELARTLDRQGPRAAAAAARAGGL